MSQKLSVLYCVLVVGLVVVLFWRNTGVAPPLTDNYLATQREEIENFSFTSLNGQEHYLSDFRGKIVFVNGWFSRCPPCVKEMPEFLELAEKHQGNMVFIALSVDRSKADMLRYIERLPNKTRALTKLDNVFFVYDEGKVISQKILKMRGFPETIIVGREGLKLYNIKGVIDWLGPKVESIFLQQSSPDGQALKHTHENAL